MIINFNFTRVDNLYWGKHDKMLTHHRYPDLIMASQHLEEVRRISFWKQILLCNCGAMQLMNSSWINQTSGTFFVDLKNIKRKG